MFISHDADTGTLVADGSKFDSSVDKGRPCEVAIPTHTLAFLCHLQLQCTHQ